MANARIERVSRKQRKPATIKDVAARARVSTATVSRVLAGLGGAGEAVRERIVRAVCDLHFEPNRAARHLRTGIRRVVGVVIPDLQNPFFTGVVGGVEAVLRARNYSLLLANSDGQAAQEQSNLAVLRTEGVVGLILIPSPPHPTSRPPLPGFGVPVVAVDRAPAGWEVDLVKIANADGAQAAVAHLISLGHRRIALLNGPAEIDVAAERLAGYEAALRIAGQARREDYIVNGDFRQAGGHAAMRRLLLLRQPPRAVFVTNNLMTLGALQAIHERGLRIPEDIAVASFDDMPWATSLQPPLTAIAQPAEDLGRAAAQMLLERIREPQHPKRTLVLETRLVVRASCGAKPTPSNSTT